MLSHEIWWLNHTPDSQHMLNMILNMNSSLQYCNSRAEILDLSLLFCYHMGPCCIWARTFVLAASSQEVAMGSWEAGPGVLDCGLPFLWSSLLPICTEWRQVLAAYWRPWPGLLKAGHNGLPRLDPLLAILQQDTEQGTEDCVATLPSLCMKVIFIWAWAFLMLHTVFNFFPLSCEVAYHKSFIDHQIWWSKQD